MACKPSLPGVPLISRRECVQGDAGGCTPSLSRGPSSPSTSTPTTDRSEDSEETEANSPSDGHRFSPEDTVLIFDWDDTFFPSSWVKEKVTYPNGMPMLADWQQDELVELSRLVEETLCLAKQLGTVLLVTNAERGWIELSCQTFMPKLLPALQDKVTVMSARSLYESPSNVSPFEWKLRAFENELERIFAADAKSNRRKNVVSLGDSSHEREALMHATANLPNCRTKSLKFVDRPDVAQLCRQHAFLVRCFSRIVHHDGNLDLFVRAT
mmetsp:Transcript_38871/g.88401  ORF Transcript_38871/g.88401 Transcript_38871/m.88401 type:complete len:269 (-) Transcript_38871:79-885(-)